MLTLPRVAVGTIQPGVDLQPMLWALMDALRRCGLQVQSFLSRACFARYHGEAAVTGLNPRHLDTWLMPPELCREIFVRGCAGCDVAIVEGEFVPASAEADGLGSRLDTLCQWLDLPKLAVLDVSQIDGGELSERPASLDGMSFHDMSFDGMLLDGVADDRHLAALTASLESLCGAPVLGALPASPALRRRVEALSGGGRPPRELCEELGDAFLRYSRVERILQLASRQAEKGDKFNLCEARQQPQVGRGLFRQIGLIPFSCFETTVVALAYDEALNCYFPDALDALEALGADVVDFSPLRDERLPDGASIVLLGCGHPERYAAELSQNHCMKLALRNHLRNGGRIYAEGGGLAYLCQELETADGQRARMAGIFPAVARMHQPPQPPQPVEVTLDRPLWLGQAGDRLRGYRNPNWRLEPAGNLAGCVVQPEYRYDVVQSCRAIGSQLHLNFAALPHVLPDFFHPPLSHLGPADPWAVVT